VTTRDKKGNEEIKEIVLRNSEGETNLMNKEDVIKNVALGAVFAPLTDKEKKELNISYGVKIKTLNSGKLKSVGFEEGMFLTKIDHDPIDNVQEATEKLSKKGKGVLLEYMTKSGKRDFIGLGL
jgi:serine protease Do